MLRIVSWANDVAADTNSKRRSRRHVDVCNPTINESNRATALLRPVLPWPILQLSDHVVLAEQFAHHRSNMRKPVDEVLLDGRRFPTGDAQKPGNEFALTDPRFYPVSDVFCFRH